MGTVDTTIGYDNITLSGEICVNKNVFYEDEQHDADIATHFVWRMRIGGVTLACWYVTDLAPNRNEFVYVIFSELGLWRDRIKIINRPFSLGEDLCLPFSINVSGYHIRRTYGIDISGPFGSGRMKPNEENPSPNPTHSIEMYAADNWITDDDPGEIHVTFGDLSWDLINGENNPPGEWPFWASVLPSDYINLTSWKYQADDAMTSCTTTLNTNLFPYNFDHVNISEKVPGSDVYCYLTGSGNKLEWWNDGGFGGRHTSCLDVLLYPPLVVDWSGYGLCDWGETKHNERYDDVLVWGGFRKVPEMDGKITWPLRSETETPDPPPLSMSGDEFEYGEEVPVPLGELRALGTYVKPAKELGEPHFWGGPHIYLRVDRKSHEKFNLYPKGDLEHPLRFPIGIPHLLDPMPDADPHFDIPVHRHDMSMDIPTPLSSRPSLWECDDAHVINLEPVSIGPVQFRTTEEGVFTLYRDLKTGWLPRCQALVSYGMQTGNWSPFPATYIIRKANYFKEVFEDWDWNDIEAKTGYTPEPEDISCYSSYRHMRVGLRIWNEELEQWVAATNFIGKEGFKLRLTHHKEQVSDSRVLDLTGPSGVRDVTVGIGAAEVSTFTGKMLPNDDYVYFDFAEDMPHIPDLTHVSKVELIIDASGEAQWSLDSVVLFDKTVDPQAMVTTHEARHAYTSGGVRGVVNGLFEHALSSPGNYRVYAGQEEVVELINWAWTKTHHLTMDNSRAWSLEEFITLVEGSCEGWKWSLPDAWEAMMHDQVGGTLGEGYSFDFAERQNSPVGGIGEPPPVSPPNTAPILTHGLGHDVSYLTTYGFKYDAHNTYPGRLGAFKWTIAPQLVYKPHGVVCVQGGIHGHADKVDTSSHVPIYRRRDDVASGGWTVDVYTGTDAYSYWYSGHDIVAEYEDGSPVFWQYRIGKKGNVVSRVYERQWIARYFSKALDAVTGGIDAMLDPWGFTWEAFTIDGSIFVRRLNRQQLTFGEPILVAQLGDGISQPAITRNHTGIIYVSVIVEGAAEPVTYISRDTAKTWEQLSSDDDGGGG